VSLPSHICRAAAVLILLGTAALAQDPTGQYANSPNAAWFGRQHSSFGGYCCDVADGHMLTDADYTFDPDGGVTLTMKDGGKIIIAPAFVHGSWDGMAQVQHGTDAPTFQQTAAPDPNPTGYPVIWYTGQLNAGDTANIYCFSPGALT
jgi:hypothetical protein